MEWYVILIIIGYAIITLLVDVKVLFFYEHPDDSKYSQGLVAKVTIIVGLQLTWILLCILPTDAFNTENQGGLDADLFWEMIYFFILIFLMFPIPFATSFYEADTDPRVTKVPAWRSALKSSAIYAICIGAVVGLTYAVLNKSEILVPDPSCGATILTAKPETYGLPPYPAPISHPSPPHQRNDFPRHLRHLRPFENLHLPSLFNPVGARQSAAAPESTRCPPILKPHTTSFFQFLAVIVTFCGWWLLVLYLGIGLGSLPIGLILSFVNRPKPISQQEYIEQKLALGDKVVVLKMAGEELRVKGIHLKELSGFKKFKESRAVKSEFNKFRQSVHLVEQEYESLNIALKLRGENPLFSYLKITAGIFSGFLSIIWLVHIVVYILVPQIIKKPPVTGVLNDVLRVSTFGQVYILELAVYEILVSYLLICCMSGCFKFNMRMFCCFSIHPMKKGETHLNSILFNTSIIIICSTALTHFSYIAFADYAKDTAASVLFGQVMRNTNLLKFFYRNNLFIWCLVLWTVTSSVFLMVKPKDKLAFNLGKKKKAKVSDPDSKGEAGEALTKKDHPPYEPSLAEKAQGAVNNLYNDGAKMAGRVQGGVEKATMLGRFGM